MNLIWVGDEDEGAQCAADAVLALLRRRPDAVLALPTGRSPRPLYAHLRAEAAAGACDARRVRVFNLDEWVGIGADDPRSFAAYLRTEFIAPLGVLPGNVRLLDGLSADPAAECAAHEAAIAERGGLDLAILGLGANGHVAFNEPGCDWAAPGRVVQLSESTRQAQHDDALPAQAMTLGLPVLLAARAQLLIVSGPGKGEALQALLAGRADPAWPATALCAQPQLTVIAPVGLRTRP